MSNERGRGAHKILKRLDGVPHRGIVLYTSHDTGGRADVLNAHTERVERLPHVGKDGMTALRIGNRQDCSIHGTQDRDVEPDLQ